jgi:hypothetical protein
MRYRITEGGYALGALTVFSVWIFLILPLLYYPRQVVLQDDASQSGQKDYSLSDRPPTFSTFKLFTTTGRDEIATFCATKANGEKDEWEHRYTCDVKITDAYLALFNFLLVVVTGGLICVGYFTIRKMRVTEERQLRAYVFVENVFYRIVGESIQATIKLKNFGSTPAHKVTLLAATKEVDWNGGEYALPMIDASKPEKLGSMAPNGDFYESDGPVVNPDFNALRLGAHAVFVTGAISYRTVFRKAETTNFRYYIGGSEPLLVGTADGEMYADAEGNDAT